MYPLFKMIQRDALNLFVNPTWFVFVLAFPFLLVTIISFMTSGLYGSNFTSYDYYGVTLMLYSSLYTGTFAANSFMEEKIKKANLRVLYFPINEGLIPLSKAVATFLYTLFYYTIVGIVIGFLYHVDYGHEWGKLWLLLAMINFLSSCFGIMMCAVFKSESIANQVMSIITTLLALTAGLLFPTYALGETFTRICQFSPIFYVVQTAFELIYTPWQTSFKGIMLLLSIASIVILFITQKLFRGEDYL